MRFRTFFWRRLKQLSMAALSAQAATLPIEPSRQAWLSARTYFRERN